MDAPEQLNKTKRKLKSDFIFLSDVHGRLMDLFNVRHVGGHPNGSDIPRSASFLLDSNGRLLWSQAAENYRVRPSPEEILEAFDVKLSR